MLGVVTDQILTRTHFAMHSRFQSQSIAMDIGRSIGAAGQLLLLILTPTTALFVPVGDESAFAKCSSGLSGLSAFCWAPPEAARWVLVAVLAIVGSGLLPRYLSWVHLYVSLCIGLVIAVPEGGDLVAVVGTLWIAFASLNDPRIWAWQKPREVPKESWLLAVAWAGHWLLRVQVAYIYLNSGIAKMAVDSWQEGSALYYVTRMEFFGATGFLGDIVHWLTAIPAVTFAASWGTMVAEVGIAILILSPPKYQRVGLALSVAFHVFIILFLGLVTFAFVMVGTVLAATAMAVKVRPAQAEIAEVDVQPDFRQLATSHAVDVS